MSTSCLIPLGIRDEVMGDEPGSKTLAQRFAESGGSPIRFGRRLVRLAFDLHIEGEEARLSIQRHRAKPDPVQGICLKMLKGGTIAVAGQTAEGIVLWSDSAPTVIGVSIRAPLNSTSADVRVWNCWRGRRGQANAWIGNSGLICEVSPDGVYRFECSDGPGEVDFSALVFTLIVIHEPGAR